MGGGWNAVYMCRSRARERKSLQESSNVQHLSSRVAPMFISAKSGQAFAHTSWAFERQRGLVDPYMPWFSRKMGACFPAVSIFWTFYLNCEH